MSIKLQVQGVIAAHLALASPDDVKMDSTLASLGADSLDTVEIVMGIEDELGIEIPDETAETWKTVQDMVTYLESRKL